MRHLLALLAAGSALAASGGYHVLKRIPVSGDGNWDYLTVEEDARRLYVSHGTQVEVLDVDTGAIVGKIPNTPGVHGIAIARDQSRGFISNETSGTVTIFKLGNLEPAGMVKTAKKPDAIIYDPSTRRVFCFNGGSESVTVFSAEDGVVKGTLKLDGAPEFAVADGQGHVFVNLEDKNETLRIDSSALTIEERWPLAPCKEPSSMAMDRENKRLFIGCGNKRMAVVNAETGKVVATLPIGENVDATAFDPATGLIFNANGEGTITVIHEDSPDQYSPVETVRTQPGAKTLALDPKTHKLFLSVADRLGPKGPIVPGSFTILVVGQ
jgi:DNA-binding beta-propeller fold protein YncE